MKPGNEDRRSWWNSLLLLLSKLGILRYGAKSYTYTSGRDRPAAGDRRGNHMTLLAISAESHITEPGDC